MLVTAMYLSATMLSLGKIFLSNSCGNWECGAGIWHGPCDSRHWRSGKAPASTVFPCGGSKPFEVLLRCPAKVPRSLPREGLGRGRVGTRRALARITRSARLAPALPFQRFEAFEVCIAFRPGLGLLPEPAGCPPGGASGALAGRRAGSRPGTPPIPARRPSCPVDTQRAPVHSPPRSPSASHPPPCPGQLLPAAPGIRKALKEEGERGSGHPHFVRSDCAARRKRCASSRRRAADRNFSGSAPRLTNPPRAVFHLAALRQTRDSLRHSRSRLEAAMRSARAAMLRIAAGNGWQ